MLPQACLSWSIQLAKNVLKTALSSGTSYLNQEKYKTFLRFMSRTLRFGSKVLKEVFWLWGTQSLLREFWRKLSVFLCCRTLWYRILKKRKSGPMLIPYGGICILCHMSVAQKFTLWVWPRRPPGNANKEICTRHRKRSLYKEVIHYSSISWTYLPW